VAASLLFARQRDERLPIVPTLNDGDDVPAERSLYAIRAAGL
jgi:hypothetical protein